MNINDVVQVLNKRAPDYKFGQLQHIRRDSIPDRQRLASRTPFNSTRRFDDHAFHVGGRCELQFNVGNDKSGLRWGVAVSLQRDHSLPDVEVQFPKLDKLSEFIRVHGDEFLSDFLMWHWAEFESDSSPEQPPDVVPLSLYKQGYFIFLGKHAPFDAFDPDVVLQDFDRLLPLYRFVEFSTSSFPVLDEPSKFEFTPGTQRSRAEADYSTTAKRTSGRAQVALRHRHIQDVLERKLHSEPDTRVSRENKNGIGGFVDLIVERDAMYEFYEVKVGNSARACIREALGQLLEYGYWPGAVQPPPGKLVVAGEPCLDDDATKYLQTLRARFDIPIEYLQVNVKDRGL